MCRLQVFEDLTPEALDIIKPDILPPIRDYVASHVNETIHHLTMRDLFHVLLGEYEFGDITHLLIPWGDIRENVTEMHRRIIGSRSYERNNTSLMCLTCLNVFVQGARNRLQSSTMHYVVMEQTIERDDNKTRRVDFKVNFILRNTSWPLEGLWLPCSMLIFDYPLFCRRRIVLYVRRCELLSPFHFSLF